MHQAGPPATARPQTAQTPGAGGKPLAVCGAWRRAFDGSSEAARDPMLRRYLGDMVRPYGVGLRADLLDEGAGYSYGDMADALFAEADVAGRDVDLVVMAHAVSDVIPGRSTAAYLSYLCRSEPLALAVCDQGNAAPFTALRLIRAYAAGAGCRRSLLLVAEQAAALYEPPAHAPLPARHAAVLIEFGDSAPGGIAATVVRAAVPPEQVPGELAARVTALASGQGDVTLVVGNGLSCALAGADSGGPAVSEPVQITIGNGALAGLPAADLVVAPAGQPCTGVWWELAGRLPAWRSTRRRVLLADYEANLGYLCLSAIDVGPAAQPGTAQPGTAQPGTAQPGTAQPDTAQPDTARPGTALADGGQQAVRSERLAR